MYKSGILFFLIIHLFCSSFVLSADPVLTPATSFRTIATALNSKESGIIEREALLLKKSRIFESYGGFFLAKSILLKALEEFQKKNYPAVIQKAKEARWKFSEVLVLDPHFPFEEKIKKNIFESELITAETYILLKNLNLAIYFYENALARIPASQIMIHFPYQSLRNYIRACKSMTLEKCESWLVVLFDKYPQKSIEYEELKKSFPAIEKRVLEKSEKKITQTYRSEDKDDILFNEAFAEYMDHDYSEASEKLEEFLIQFPGSKHSARALFWLSQSYKKRGKDEKFLEASEKLFKQYPFTYYGLLGSLELKKNIDDFVLSKEPPPIEKNSFGLKKGEKEALERIEYFIKNKLYSFAKEELMEFPISARMSKDFLMYLAQIGNQAQASLASFRFLNEYFNREPQRAPSIQQLEIIFPQFYLNKITPLAQKFSLDPLLVLSLIKQESGFNDQAISHAGAVGLMQLMPFTAVAVQPKTPQSNVHSIQKNLEIGIEHFANEVKFFKGNIPAALAAYNAGAGRTRGWYNEALKKNANLPEFVEHITYAETRGYVSGILRNYYWYLKKIENKAISDFEYLYVKAE